MIEFGGYYVQRLEPGLWTVGFDFPDTGIWDAESDHDSDRAARRRAWELNGIEGRYAYIRNQSGLWTVGDCRRNFWDPVTDHTSADEAASRVMQLNA